MRQKNGTNVVVFFFIGVWTISRFKFFFLQKKISCSLKKIRPKRFWFCCLFRFIHHRFVKCKNEIWKNAIHYNYKKRSERKKKSLNFEAPKPDCLFLWFWLAKINEPTAKFGQTFFRICVSMCRISITDTWNWKKKYEKNDIVRMRKYRKLFLILTILKS